MIPFALIVPLFAPLRTMPSTAQDAAQEFEFRCIPAVSLDRHVEDRWYHTAGSVGVSLSSTSSVVRKQYFAVYPFFTNPKTDENGRASVRFEARILKPDGTAYFEAADFGAYEGRIGAPGGIYLSRSILHACFEPEDAQGTYTVQLVAHDVVSGKKSEAEHRLELVDYEEGDAFSDDEELNRWVDAYFEAPDPQRAIPALRAFAEHGLENEKPRDGRGFLREVFEANHWLFTELVARDAKLTGNERSALLWLLARSTYDAKSYTSKLGAEDAQAWIAVRAAVRDPMEEPITGRLDVNELWGMYTASRRYALIERMCLALAGDDTGVVADENLKSEDGEVPLRLVIGEVFGDLLAQMAKADGPTRNYLEWTSAQESVPKSVRDAIDAVLAPANESEER